MHRLKIHDKYLLVKYVKGAHTETLNRRELAQGMFNPSLSSNVSNPFAEKYDATLVPFGSLWFNHKRIELILVLVFSVSHLTSFRHVTRHFFSFAHRQEIAASSQIQMFLILIGRTWT